MTEETKPKYLEDLLRYQYANVAARLSLNKEDAQFVPGALEKLVDSFGIDKDVLSGLREGTFASKEGIQRAVDVYADKYQKALGTLDVTEFYDVRLGTLKSILGEEKANESKTIFGKYKGQTISSIITKYSQAHEIYKSKSGLYDNKKKEEAEKTIGKLEPIVQLIELLEKRNYEELRNGATKSTYKEMITEILKKA